MKLFWITILGAGVITFFSMFAFMNLTGVHEPVETKAIETDYKEFLISSGRGDTIKGFAPIGDKRTNIKGLGHKKRERTTLQGFNELEDKRSSVKGWRTNRDSLKDSNLQN